jgi:hypothetical protein
MIGTYFARINSLEIMSKPLSHLPIFSISLFLILSFSFLPIISNAWSATYYVDATNGNDANSGLSPSTPWKTSEEKKLLDPYGQDLHEHPRSVHEMAFSASSRSDAQ